jgi:LysM repeat protein
MKAPAQTRVIRKERTPVRLTRRGRAVVLSGLLVITAALAVLTAAAGQAADPQGPPPTTVVEQGDTLWSIAERHAPRRDRFGTVDEIRRLNKLDGYEIRTGQQLVLPRTG